MIKRVTFRDDGQDFLEWDIEYPEGDDFVGKVVACRPFQADIWVGTEVYSRDIRPGDLLPMVPPSTRKPMTLIHPVESVEEMAIIP